MSAATQSFESRVSVLVVEDDHDTRVSIRSILEEEGYKVLTATDGKNALDLLAHTAPKPRLIILDLMLPVMDGWHFAREVAARPQFAHIPIIVMSAFDDPPPPSGVVGFLKKPVNIDGLLGVVGNYCE